jgi:hypothetical protein
MARTRQKKMKQRFWWLNFKERGHIEDTDVDDRIILKWKVNSVERVGLNSSRFRTKTSGGLL